MYDSDLSFFAPFRIKIHLENRSMLNKIKNKNAFQTFTAEGL